jgi:hypothetical protein
MTHRTARITQLRESIARRALTAAGIPTHTRILDVVRLGTVFVIATADTTNRWAPYTVETFRIPEPDDTDRDYEPGTAPKIWCPLAGWIGHGIDEIPALFDKARHYVHHELAA